eukprot:COSAG06_NODE_12445_length_1380_cov_56.729118_3_plen_71_part_01
MVAAVRARAPEFVAISIDILIHHLWCRQTTGTGGLKTSMNGYVMAERGLILHEPQRGRHGTRNGLGCSDER